MFGKRLRQNVRGALTWTSGVSLIVVTAILGGAGAFLTALAGLTVISDVVLFAALLTGITEALFLYRNPDVSGTIPLKTLAMLILYALFAGGEYLIGQPSLEGVTAIAAAALIISTLSQEIAAYIASLGNAPPAPSS